MQSLFIRTGTCGSSPPSTLADYRHINFSSIKFNGSPQTGGAAANNGTLAGKNRYMKVRNFNTLIKHWFGNQARHVDIGQCVKNVL